MTTMKNDKEFLTTIREHRKPIQRQLMEDFSNLREEDFDFKPGEEDAMLGHIERRIGRSRQELKTMIGKFSGIDN